MGWLLSAIQKNLKLKKVRDVMPNKRIVIITNGGSSKGYLIGWMAESWADSGYSVEFISNPNTKIEADIVFLHVNLTCIPLAYLDLLKRIPVVINRSVGSISKDLFSNQILEKPFGYDGKVIVKTKENYGGLPELERGNYSKTRRKIILKTKDIAMSKSLSNRFVKSFLWRKVRVLDSNNYPIFDSIEDVPPGVWKNPRLIVEKFLPEQDADGRYVLRHWYFFGDKEFNRTLAAFKPIPKWSNLSKEEKIRSREEWREIKIVSNADVPQEVRAVREKLGMDFGRIDWAWNNGKPIVFDANKTPGGVGLKLPDSDIELNMRVLISEFSRGVEYFKR